MVVRVGMYKPLKTDSHADIRPHQRMQGRSVSRALVTLQYRCSYGARCGAEVLVIGFIGQDAFGPKCGS